MNVNKKSKYTKIVAVRFKPEEYEALLRKCKASTTKQKTVYIRNMALGKPVIVTYRNASIDEFLSEMIKMKNELNAIGNNFNQVVKRLHTLDTIPQIKNWLLLNESNKEALMETISDIKDRTVKLYDQWLLK